MEVGYVVDSFSIKAWRTSRMSAVTAMSVLFTHEKHDTTTIASAYTSMTLNAGFTDHIRLIHLLVGGKCVVISRDKVQHIRRLLRFPQTDDEPVTSHYMDNVSEIDMSSHVVYLEPSNHTLCYSLIRHVSGIRIEWSVFGRGILLL